MRKPKVRKHRSKLFAKHRRIRKNGWFITKNMLVKVFEKGDIFTISRFIGFPND